MFYFTCDRSLNCERLLLFTLQEETAVAEKYARLIASNQLSMDDVDQILGKHTRSVHLLRMRQGDERQRLLDRLDAKRQARRAAAGDNNDDDDIGKTSTSEHVSSELKFGDMFFDSRCTLLTPISLYSKNINDNSIE